MNLLPELFFKKSLDQLQHQRMPASIKHSPRMKPASFALPEIEAFSISIYAQRNKKNQDIAQVALLLDLKRNPLFPPFM